METKLRPIADALMTVYANELSIFGVTEKAQQLKHTIKTWATENQLPYINPLGSPTYVIKFTGFRRKYILKALKHLLRKHQVTCRITVVNSNKQKNHLLTFFYRHFV
jgi:hypothetical protein